MSVQSFSPASSADAVIIGGGVIGLAIARALAMRGVRDLTVVEKNEFAREASWAAGGILAPQVEADAADAGLVLDQSEGKMSFAAADFLGRLGERDARGTEDRPRVAHAEGCHLLDLPHDLGSELREGGFAIDADFYVADAPGGLR